MTRLLRTLGAVALVLGACGGGSGVSTSPGDGSAATGPAPTTATTASPTTAAPTTSPPTSTTIDPANLAVAERIPAVPGYSYGEMRPLSWWFMDGGLTAASKPVLVEGSWVAEISVVDAGASTPDVWASFVNDHHSELGVLGGEPLATPDGFVST